MKTIPHVCKNHDHCCVEMAKEDNKMLKCNHGEKSVKVPFIIYPNVESLLKKISTCHNNPEEDCMERFGKDLKEHVTKIVNYEQKK